MVVKLVRDVGVPLDRVGHLEAERRELAHLAQEEDQPVGVIPLEREIVLVDLHQLARQLQRQPQRGVLEIVLDVAVPVRNVLLLEVVHVLQQVARFGLGALHALQVAQHHLGRLQRLPTLVGHLARQQDLLDRRGQVLAGPLPLADGLAAAHLRVLAQDLEVVLELAEQRLARRRSVAEDRLASGELAEAHELEQQPVPLEAGQGTFSSAGRAMGLRVVSASRAAAAKVSLELRARRR